MCKYSCYVCVYHLGQMKRTLLGPSIALGGRNQAGLTVDAGLGLEPWLQ